jgi:hypothetical protein
MNKLIDKIIDAKQNIANIKVSEDDILKYQENSNEVMHTTNT